MKKRILLAEDDEFTQYMMKAVFNALGYEFDVASDGEECQRLVNKNPDLYGVILMDIHMPKVSGVEATRAIRSLSDDPPRSIPIIAVTADEDYLTEDALQSNKMNGHLKKPIVAAEVNLLVEQYCAA